MLLLRKPLGLSSQQAVARVKRLFSARKAGHTGTLDPMADGLLPIGLGEATKFSRFLLDSDKRYLATLKLGATTSTGDAEGAVLERRSVAVTVEALSDVLKRCTGSQVQTPPMYSAVKIDGKPLYQYARAGLVIERKSREICVHSIQLIDFHDDLLKLRVSCSKGTYIRVLAEDIGNALGCGAHLAALTREMAGNFELDCTRSLEELERMSADERMAQLLPVDAFASSLPRLTLAEGPMRRITMGQAVEMDGTAPGIYRLYGPADLFCGVGQVDLAELHALRLVTQDGNLPALKQDHLNNPLVTG